MKSRFVPIVALALLVAGCGDSRDDTAAVATIVGNYTGKEGCKVESVPGAQLTTATEESPLGLGTSRLTVKMDGKAVESIELNVMNLPAAGVMAFSDCRFLVGDPVAWVNWSNATNKPGTFTTTINGWNAKMVRSATPGGTPQFTLTISR